VPESREARGAQGVEPFIAAVLSQLFGSAGAYGGSPASELDRVVRSLSHLVETPDSDAARDTVARELLRDPALASAVFQNIDLLYDHRFPGADAVGRVMMHLIQLESETEREGA
jgi:hypothetical protein